MAKDHQCVTVPNLIQLIVFESVHQESDLEHVEWDQEYLREIANRKIEYLTDDSESIVSQNNSPDIPFRYSVNPYRGCAHGCSYCYARNTHEFLGFNAGLDFETKIIVKHDAAKLFRRFLAKDSWRPEPIMFSGVTDCYQPVERQHQLTRQCLRIALECQQPIEIITKNALVVRDLDILSVLAQKRLAHVFLSINSLTPKLAREMEPRTSIPAARIRAVSTLADAKIPVGVMVSPIVPGLNDSEIPAVLEAAKDAGAMAASYIMLRLPTTVEPVFIEWLERTQPTHAAKVLNTLRRIRGGKLSSAKWGERMKGSGSIANQIQNLFQLFARKYDLDHGLPALNCELFCPPLPESGQRRLF